MIDSTPVGLRPVDIEWFIGADIVLHEMIEPETGTPHGQIEFT